MVRRRVRSIRTMVAKGPPSTRELDPRAVRSRGRLVEATQDLLAERGFAALTVEAVAERAGVARTTVYRNFGSLPDLVAAALDALSLPPAPPDSGDVMADTIQVLGGLAEALRHSAWGRLVPALLHAADHDEGLAEVQRRFVQRRREGLLSVLRQGVREGRLRADVDVDLLCDALAGALYYRRLVTRQAWGAGAVAALAQQVLGPCLVEPAP